MTTSPAQSPHTPAVGSAERAAILDAARAPAVRELGKAVQFKVEALNVQQGWVFVRAAMLEADGQPLSYAGTRFEEASASGMKSRSFAALLRERDGGWAVIVYSVGPTDVAWQGWADDYAAPDAIFVLPSN